MIRVFLADDQALVRDGLRRLLEYTGEFSVSGEAASGKETIGMLQSAQADVLILDMRMPNGDAIDVLRELAATERSLPTLIVTTFDDYEALIAAAQHGASGFMLKDVTFERLRSAISTVLDGGVYFQPTMTETIRRLATIGIAGEADPGYPQALTEREIDVLRLMAGGYGNKEIATALKISTGTVKNHVSNVLGKLFVGDRTRAVLRAIGLGII